VKDSDKVLGLPLGQRTWESVPYFQKAKEKKNRARKSGGVRQKGWSGGACKDEEFGCSDEKRRLITKGDRKSDIKGVEKVEEKAEPTNRSGVGYGRGREKRLDEYKSYQDRR